MEFQTVTPKPAKKRAPVKRQASVLWESQEKLTPELKLEELVLQLQKQLSLLQREVQLLQEAMDHLLQEDSTADTLSEEEAN